MWMLYAFLYIILSVIFNQNYKVVTKYSQSDGSLTVLIQSIAGFSILLLCPFFKFSFPTDWKVYMFLCLSCIFYGIADRVNTTVRSNIEASTFSVIKQLSNVFMIITGLLFFKEPFIWRKIIGAFMIIFSNLLIFYKKENKKPNKYVLYGILSTISFSIALSLDVNFSNNFNLPFYVSSTLLIPALFITIIENIKLKDIIKEFCDGNKKSIIITSLCWGLMLVSQLMAYELGKVTMVAPICALTVIGNVMVGYIFFKERKDLLKKWIAAILIVISIILINS